MAILVIEPWPGAVKRCRVIFYKAKASMAAPKRNAMWIEETRKKVQASQLINRLQDHVLGTVELSSTQVRAAEILLKKTLPDLTENKNVHISSRVSDFTDGELASIIEGDSGEGAAETPRDPSQLN